MGSTQRRLPAAYEHFLDTWHGFDDYYAHDAPPPGEEPDVRYMDLVFFWRDTLDGERLDGWPEHLLVIAQDSGDPYCLDLRRDDTQVLTAMHGAGRWDFPASSRASRSPAEAG